MSDTPESKEVSWSSLTEEQQAACKQLPATSSDVAEALSISTDAAYKRLKRSPQAYQDDDGIWVWNGEKDLHRMKTHHTGTITRHANNILTEDEEAIKTLLNKTEPATEIQDPKPSNEDVVFALGDLHVGDLVTDDRDRVIFDTEVVMRRVREIIKTGITYTRQLPETDIDTCHVLINGDAVTNTNIYEAQWENLDHQLGPTIKDQINNTAELLMWAIKTLAEEFETVQVVCQPGNHGENRASGVSKQANADVHLMSRLDFGVRQSDYDNINFVFHDSTKYTNFKMRGGEMRGHLRHGEECQEHAGATSASKRDWRGWKDMHQFDVAIRGHYHTGKLERTLGKPVIMAGSVKPPDDFEESISEWCGPGAVVFGVSDTEVPTWMRFITWDE